ncbi:MAG: helix-turn-helix domain-containing protein [Candidatus Absconditabacterales bacterium]
MDIKHPGHYLQQKLKERGWTQKDFARLLGKKVSEVNELIKGKRNITVHRDILLSVLFDDPEQKWCRLQLEYDYYLGKQNIDPRKLHEIKATKDSEGIINNEQGIITIETLKHGDTKTLKHGDTEKKDKHKEHEIFRNF